MDGPVFRRVVPTIILFAAGCVLLPAALRGQAMGKLQLDPPPTLAIGPSVATVSVTGPQDVVALASEPRKPPSAGADPAAAPLPAVPLAAPPHPLVKTPVPLTDLAPATQPLSAPPATVAPPSSVSALETSLIRSSGKSVDGGKTAGSATETGAIGSTSLYARFASVIQVGGALGIVVGLIFMGRGLARKFIPGVAVGAGKGVMEVLARYPLAKNQALVLVRIGSQLVVLNQTRDASASVLVISEPLEVANILGQVQGAKPTSMQQNFSNLLANARMDLETTPPDQGQPHIEVGDLDAQLDEMAAAKRQLLQLRQQVRAVRENLPQE